jgi:hypothetical protein
MQAERRREGLQVTDEALLWALKVHIWQASDWME